MEERHRRILERNRNFLVKNIILTDEFYRLLRQDAVIPETMLRDVQDGKTREESNCRLLQTLCLRGGDCFRKFRQILFTTGHLFLADLLHEEEAETKVLKPEELFNKFPGVFTHVSDDVKSKFIRYLEAKVREKALENTWSKSAFERSEILEAKKAIFEQEKEFKLRIDSKKKQMKDLNLELNRLNDELKKRDLEMDTLAREIGEMRKGFKADLEKQAKFNSANNNSVVRLKDRFNMFNDKIRNMNVLMRGFLNADEKFELEDPDNVKVSLLERNVRKVLQIARANMETATTSITEKDSVLNMLNMSAKRKDQPLSEVVKKYVEKEERGKIALWQEIDTLSEVIRGRSYPSFAKKEMISDFKMLKAQVATLRVEAEHIRKKLEWKDNQITELIQENSHLRERQVRDIQMPRGYHVEQHSSLHESPQMSPESAYAFNVAYTHYDRYLSEVGTPSKRKSPRRGSLAEVNLEREPSPTIVISRKKSGSISVTENVESFRTGRRSSTVLIDTDAITSITLPEDVQVQQTGNKPSKGSDTENSLEETTTDIENLKSSNIETPPSHRGGEDSGTLPDTTGPSLSKTENLDSNTRRKDSGIPSDGRGYSAAINQNQSPSTRRKDSGILPEPNKRDLSKLRSIGKMPFAYDLNTIYEQTLEEPKTEGVRLPPLQKEALVVDMGHLNMSFD